MTVYLSSDPHFGHKNILGYCNRPYANVAEMDDDFIIRHNARVQPNDTWICMGDVGFYRGDRIADILDKLNGHKHLILGNHDHQITKSRAKDCFESIKNYDEQTYMIDGKKVFFILFHYPIASWNGRNHGSIMCHGHSHGGYKAPGEAILDVGVDCHDYYPISIIEAYTKAMANKALPRNKIESIIKDEY